MDRSHRPGGLRSSAVAKVDSSPLQPEPHRLHCGWELGTVKRSISPSWNTTFEHSQSRPGGVSFVRQLLTSAILLSQLQLVWLTGFHYHPSVSVPQQSAPIIASGPGQHTPADEGSSCPFCQLVRHSISAPAASRVVSFDSLRSTRISPLVPPAPLTAPQLRLPGRDPPLSL